MLYACYTNLAVIEKDIIIKNIWGYDYEITHHIIMYTSVIYVT